MDDHGGGGAGGAGDEGGQQEDQQDDMHLPPGQGDLPGAADDSADGADDVDDIDDDIMIATQLGEKEELRELLGAAQLTRSREDFMALLVRLLFTVSHTGDCHCLKVLLAFDVDVNTPLNDHGDTVLHAAARYNTVSLVELLMNNYCLATKRNRSDYTAVDIACHGGQKEFVEAVLKHPCISKASVVDPYLWYTALITATQDASVDIMRLLLDFNKDAVLLNIDEDIGTALHVACEEDRIECVDVLVEAGADVEAMTSRVSQTPLMRAAECGQVNVLRRLLDHGAQLDRQTDGASCALIMACHFGQVEAVRFLLEVGANPHLINPWGFDPLFMGADNPAIVRELLPYIPDLDRLCGERGEGAIHLAAVVGSAESIRLMLEAGADIDNQTSVGETIIWLAALKGHVEVAKLVVRLNCDLNVPSNGCRVFAWDYTPLELALGKGRFDIAKILLKAGCSVYNPVYFKPDDRGPLDALIWARIREETLRFLEEDTASCKWFFDFLANPRSLKDICRIKVRHFLGKSIVLEKNAKLLHAPKELISDILFADL